MIRIAIVEDEEEELKQLMVLEELTQIHSQQQPAPIVDKYLKILLIMKDMEQELLLLQLI